MTSLETLFDGELPHLVMFDLDGTLVDSVPDLAGAVDGMLRQLGRAPAGVERVKDWVGNGAQVLVRRALAGRLEHDDVSDQATEEALPLFLKAYAGSHVLTTVYPGVRECLSWLVERDVPLAIITNKPSRFVAPLLAEKGLGDHFRWLVGGDTLPQQKPDPAALFWVMEKAGVSAGQALFVGDSRNDVLAARAAGVRCVGMTYGYNHGRPIAEESPDRVLDDLRLLVASA